MAETTASSASFAVDQGTLYDLGVRIHNAAAGGSGEYSNWVYGFSSNIAVVYNDSDTPDTTTANNIKTALTTDLPTEYGPIISGTMPVWTVTLVPESIVSSTAAAANVVSGRPVIITPNSTLYTDDNKVYNVAAHGHGLIAMGYGGTHLLDRVNANWSSWSFTGTQPSSIGWLHTATGINNCYMYTWTTSNIVWYYPLKSQWFTNPPDPVQHNYRFIVSYTDLNRASVYIYGGTPPSGVYIWGKDDLTSNNYFPVVNQGRFLHFGFYGLPDRYYTGWAYWTNVTFYMSLY
jgi:hypothetical protein